MGSNFLTSCNRLIPFCMSLLSFWGIWEWWEGNTRAVFTLLNANMYFYIKKYMAGIFQRKESSKKCVYLRKHWALIVPESLPLPPVQLRPQNWLGSVNQEGKLISSSHWDQLSSKLPWCERERGDHTVLGKQVIFVFPFENLQMLMQKNVSASTNRRFLWHFCYLKNNIFIVTSETFPLNIQYSQLLYRSLKNNTSFLFSVCNFLLGLIKLLKNFPRCFIVFMLMYMVPFWIFTISFSLLHRKATIFLCWFHSYNHG